MKWILTLEKSCIKCCWRNASHFSKILSRTFSFSRNFSRPDSTQANVFGSTLHPWCLIMVFWDFAGLCLLSQTAFLAFFRFFSESRRLRMLDSDNCRAPTEGNQIACKGERFDFHLEIFLLTWLERPRTIRQGSIVSGHALISWTHTY